MLESEGFFLFYVAVLGLSGVLMLVIAALGLGATPGMRALNGVLGLGALGYVVYLISTVFVNGGGYTIFIYAFILPIIAIVNLFKGLKARNEAPAEPQAPQAPAA